MSRSHLGYADLLRALYRFPDLSRADLAELLGWELRVLAPVVVEREEPDEKATSDRPTPTSALRPVAPVPSAVGPSCFWRATEFHREGREPRQPEKPRKALGEPKWEAGEKLPAPSFHPLCPWEALIPRLRSGLLVRPGGGRVDWGQVVARIARAEALHRFPRQAYRRWGERVQVVLDRSDRLVPFFDDQDQVYERLKQLIPQRGLEAVVGDSPGSWRVANLAAETAGGTVLVLGDLGSLQVGGSVLCEEWRVWGQQLQDQGCRPLALVPCATERVSAGLQQAFAIIPWQRLPHAHIARPEERDQAVTDLFVRAAPATRLEPGLLRAIRSQLRAPPGAADDASLEAEFWQHPWVISPHPEAATLDPERVQSDLLPRFEALDRTIREEVLRAIRGWRPHPLEPVVWLHEYTRLAPESQSLFREDAVDAASMIANLKGRLREGEGAVMEFLERAVRRLPEVAWKSTGYGPAYRQFYIACFPDGPPPPGWGPRDYPPDASTHTLDIHQVGSSLLFTPATPTPPTSIAPGSFIGRLTTTNRKIQVEEPTEVPEQSFWEGGTPPAWAEDWGRDPYGPWVTFRAGEVAQKMRWIPPGTFLMGSPETEKGRFDDEGPQHPVTLTRGFWLFDTPCTQELWMAVMGGKKNPSRFQGPQRPVEQVSFEDVEEFLKRFNDRVRGSGLDITLPTEAQWEYACRAGTKKARYGPLKEVAWHDGNSKGETRPVGEKSANGWGLYDMLGNVYEWCLDGHRNYTNEHQFDPIGPRSAGAVRVFRGGSWLNDAHYVRAACRDAFPPDYRDDDLGFRCLSSGAVRPTERVQPAAEVGGRKAEPGPPPETSGGTSAVAWGPEGLGRALLRPAPIMIIRTDLDEIKIVCEKKPDWASVCGRDRFGLWADVEIPEKGTVLAKQRLRWVPPGSFLMGSPESEQGRYADEGPQHEVILKAGYWLFDTPCTQALWTAVMRPKKNPSRFQDPQRPVEQVTFEEVGEFLERINDRVPGLGLSLPTEAQWEYACRAGTTTSTYAGDVEIHGNNNAPGLDAIAWYGGNSGRDYDLKESHDASGWEEKQYPDTRAGTRKVGTRRPNGWGLYDMLGNVLEWCLDGNRSYTKEQILDPIGPTEAGADRVIRGGGWEVTAQGVRAACRFAYDPGDRADDLGFRCLSSGRQTRDGGEGVGEAGAGRSVGGATRRPRPTNTPPSR